MKEETVIHPLGKVSYDETRKTLTLERGVIEENGVDDPIDPSKRTYIGVQRRIDGSFCFPETGGIMLREPTPRERESWIREFDEIMKPRPIKDFIKDYKYDIILYTVGIASLAYIYFSG